MTKLLKGAVSITLLKPEKVPGDMAKIREKLAEFAFQKLDPADFRDESTGWVDALLCFDNKNFSSLLHDNFLLFAFRVDFYSFSASQLRPYLEEAEFTYKKENEVEYIAAQQKKEIREEVVKRMKRNSYPKTTVAEVAWDMETSLIYLFTQANGTIVKFTDLFEKTFETTLETVSIFDSVKELGKGSKQEPISSILWGQE